MQRLDLPHGSEQDRRSVSSSQAVPGWLATEAALRELAFVLHLTRKLKAAILETPGGGPEVRG